MGVYDKDIINELHKKAHVFWKDNCLYLDSTSRKAFQPCMTAAINLSEQLKADLKDPVVTKLMEENWEKVREFGKTLEEGVLLPSLWGNVFPPEM